MEDDWQTIPEAARTLSKSERTIYRWARQGRIPVDRSVSPLVVNVGNVSTGAPMAAKVAGGEIEGLRAEVARLRERIEGLEADKAYLQNALAAALMPRKMIEATPRRRWRWPWQKQ